jgi:hypothetical protein
LGQTEREKEEQNRNRKKLDQLRRGVEKSLDKHSTYPNVNEKSVRRPVADELNERGGNTMFCQRSGTSSSHGLGRDVTVKEQVKTHDEEVTGWYQAFGCKPKW